MMFQTIKDSIKSTRNFKTVQHSLPLTWSARWFFNISPKQPMLALLNLSGKLSCWKFSLEWSLLPHFMTEIFICFVCQSLFIYIESMHRNKYLFSSFSWACTEWVWSLDKNDHHHIITLELHSEKMAKAFNY